MDVGILYNKLENDINALKLEKKKLKEELEFYKSLFNTHHNSVIFNLKIKKIKGKEVWVDNIRDSKEYINSLDKDEEVIEWLKPVKCER